MVTESLSFRLRIAHDHEDLQRVCAVRSLGYGHHLPDLADGLLDPDLQDGDPSTVILLCEDKLTGRAIGTARVQVTTRGSGRLSIEQCIELPDHMREHGRAEITRLSAVPGADPRVRLVLWKAGYLYCLATQARWLLIGARSPALVRSYRRLGATELYEDGRTVPLSYAGGLPHYVLTFNVMAAERDWFVSNNALYGFMFDTVHPDLHLFSPRSLFDPIPSVRMPQASHPHVDAPASAPGELID